MQSTASLNVRGGLWGACFFSHAPSRWPETVDNSESDGCEDSVATTAPHSSCGDPEMPELLDEDSDDEEREPCNHNVWDNLRTKREVVSLRCRVCSSQWKAPLDYLRERKCQHFVKTCPIEGCTRMHIFKYKLPAKTRTKLLKQQHLE